MVMRPLCAGLALAGALFACGCSCCKHGCAPATVASAPPCCPPPVAAPAPCCGNGPAAPAVQAYSVPPPPIAAYGH